MSKDENSGVGPGQNMRFSDIVIDNPELSLAAKGVFATLGLMGNSCTIDELVQRSSDGEPTLRSAVDELERAGYVEVSEGVVRLQSAGSFGLAL